MSENHMIERELLRELLIETHRYISEEAERAVAGIGEPTREPSVSYPPNGDLTPLEGEALRNLRVNDLARSALGKIMKDVAAGAMFRLFTLCDGVGNGPPRRDGAASQLPWRGVMLASKESGPYPMLHDEFYDTYWDFADAVKRT